MCLHTQPEEHLVKMVCILLNFLSSWIRIGLAHSICSMNSKHPRQLISEHTGSTALDPKGSRKGERTLSLHIPKGARQIVRTLEHRCHFLNDSFCRINAHSTYYVTPFWPLLSWRSLIFLAGSAYNSLASPCFGSFPPPWL